LWESSKKDKLPQLPLDCIWPVSLTQYAEVLPYEPVCFTKKQAVPEKKICGLTVNIAVNIGFDIFWVIEYSKICVYFIR
jgi:hypothetical protein